MEHPSPHDYLVSAINGSALWANLFLLFWLSLIPSATEWITANHFARVPVAIYGSILLMSGIAYRLLAGILARHCGKDSELPRAPGDDWKGKAVYRNLCHRDNNRITVIRAGLCIICHRCWYLVYPGQAHREKSS